MSTESDYDAAAAWAEDQMTLKAASRTARRGDAATQFGRETLERALGGRPSIDPGAQPGQHSRVRQVRLPAEVNTALDALAETQHRSPSAILRDALTRYLQDPSLPDPDTHDDVAEGHRGAA